MGPPLANIQPDEIIRRYQMLLAAKTDEAIRVGLAAEVLAEENQRLIIENQQLKAKIAETDSEFAEPVPPPVDV